MAVTLTNADKALKSYYLEAVAEQLDLKANPLLAEIAKSTNDVWGKDFPADIRTVDVHVRRLRFKLEEDDANPEYILTKWGVGYYFKAE